MIRTARPAIIVSFEAFVIFHIVGGCECCAEGQRETVLPGAIGRTRDDVRVLLAAGHRGVHFTQIMLDLVERADGLTAEQVEALREQAKPAGQLVLF